MRPPIISVVMSVYNEEDFLSDAINSILNQSEQNFEFIIIDDASTDKSVDIIKGYEDQRIRLYVNPENRGLTKNLNKGLRLARGSFIARMDGDDISHPDRFRKQLKYLEQHREIMLCSCCIRSFGQIQTVEKKHKRTSEQLRVMMLFQPVLMHPGFMMRRKLIEDGMFYDESFRTAQDYDFQVRVSEKYDVGIVNCTLLNYRVHKKQVSNIRNNEQSSNANRTRQRQLKKLGISLNPEEERVYYEWVLGKKHVNVDDFKDAEKIAKRIIAANEGLKLYKQEILFNELYKFLFRWMIKSGTKKKIHCICSLCGFNIKKWILCIQEVFRLIMSFSLKTTGNILQDI